MKRALTVLLYGPSKAGKSSLAITAPGPRLLLDSEGGASRFLPIKSVYWNPLTEPLPENDGSWDTVVVVVDTYDKFKKSIDYIRSGQHQFRSVIVDSVTELQDRLMTKIVGNSEEAPKLQQWGEILRHMNSSLRDLRDLPQLPESHVEVVVLTALAKDDARHAGKKIPSLQGSAASSLPYYYDITGAIHIQQTPNPNPSLLPIKKRVLNLEDGPEYYAGERIQGKLGTVIPQEYLDISLWMDTIYGKKA